MKNEDRPVAKSLHTITVVVQIANAMKRLAGANSDEAAVDLAMVELGLAGRPDPYGLGAKALKLLAA